MRLSAAAVYRAAAVIGLRPAELSLWEYHALLAGWNEANTPEGAPGSEPQAPALTDGQFAELMAEHG